MKKPAKKITQRADTSSKPKVLPLGDRILVRPISEAEKKGKNNFGIILPESVEKEKSAEAIVLAVGAGRYVDGKLVPVSVRVGDIVLYSKYQYDEVTVDGEELYILKEETILAVITR
ncbi:MAG: chaperonin Cpn10 [Parcubacteria group bacterium]|nr:chaperonin Cpn10 [Parcubacteria group bacterium]